MGSRSRGSEPAEETTSQQDILETSPFEGDLGAELAARPRSGVRPGLTVYLGAAVLLVAGFVAGVQADKHWGKGSSSGSPNAAGLIRAAGRGTAATGGKGSGGKGGGFGGSSGSSGGFGGGFGGRAGGGGTVGTIKLVDGDTVYIQTPDGSVVAVKTTSGTRVSIARNGTVSQLSAGQTVIVTGTPASDGSVTASSISESTLGGTRSGG
jgi:hypothetical protein